MKNYYLIENWLEGAKDTDEIIIDGITYTAASFRTEQPIKVKGNSNAKFNNKKVYVDGTKFDSEAEYNRYCDLLLLERAGVVRIIKLQPKFEIHPETGDQKAIHYIGDFMYIDFDGEAPVIVVEDVKGGKATATQHFKDKAKMFRSKYGDQYELRIFET